jgi:hypothetical protein
MNGEDIVSLLGFALLGVAGATVLVEKRDEAPVSLISNFIRWMMTKLRISYAAKLLECTVCCSFWMAGVLELMWGLWFGKSMTGWSYWPFSGLVASAISFYMIDFLNTIDKNS